MPSQGTEVAESMKEHGASSQKQGRDVLDTVLCGGRLRVWVPARDVSSGMVALSVSLWKRISVEAHPIGNETLGGGKTFLFFFPLGQLNKSENGNNTPCLSRKQAGKNEGCKTQ